MLDGHRVVVAVLLVVGQRGWWRLLAQQGNVLDVLEFRGVAKESERRERRRN